MIKTVNTLGTERNLLNLIKIITKHLEGHYDGERWDGMLDPRIVEEWVTDH